MTIRWMMWIIAAALLLGAPASAEAQMQVAPPMVYLGGDARFGTFLVANRTTQPREVQIDFRFGYPVSDSLGQQRMAYGDTLAAAGYSMQSWVRAFPRQFILQPGQRQTVRLTARPPADLPDGMYWTRLVTTSTPLTPQVDSLDNGVAAQIVLRIEQITTVLYRQGTVNTQVAVDGLELDVDTAAVTVRAPLSREGNAPFLGNATLTIRGTDGRVVGRRTENFSMYVDMVRRYRFDRSVLPPGEYTAELRIVSERPDIPREDLVQIAPVVEEVTFRVP